MGGFRIVKSIRALLIEGILAVDSSVKSSGIGDKDIVVFQKLIDLT